MIVGRIWQAIAQSGVDLSYIPREQQDTLVAAIADSMMVTIDDMLGDVQHAYAHHAEPAPPVAGAEEEQVLWEGRPFLSLVESYIVTTERIRIQSGLFSNRFDDIELIRIQDIDFSQTMTERMVNVGDIIIRSANMSNPEVVLNNVKDPQTVHEIIRRAMMQARKREGLSFREEM
jgi:hypothetical protein